MSGFPAFQQVSAQRANTEAACSVGKFLSGRAATGENAKGERRLRQEIDLIETK